MSSTRGYRGGQSGSSSVSGGSKAAGVPSSRTSGRGLVDVSAIHETVLTRVNDTLLAFKFGGEIDANPVLSQLIPVLATAVAVAVSEVMKTVTQELEERLAARSFPASDELVMTNLAHLTYENDRLNQYTRRESFRISGVTVQQGETALGVEQKALKVFADAGATVVPDDIAAVHRAGKARNGTQPVLVRFVSRRKRREVMEKKKTWTKKQGYKGIFLNDDLTHDDLTHDDLTPLRARLLGFVKRLEKVERAWTTDGRIYVKKKFPPGLHLADHQQRPVVFETPDNLFKQLEVILSSEDFVSLGLGHLRALGGMDTGADADAMHDRGAPGSQD
ncbi:hypothetical protein ACOMHN_014794 [Nucella lapillus]